MERWVYIQFSFSLRHTSHMAGVAQSVERETLTNEFISRSRVRAPPLAATFFLDVYRKIFFFKRSTSLTSEASRGGPEQYY